MTKEISKTRNKGITLIALIITIIVMLILVGVTVNVALNGGLFDTAQQAGKQTEIEADREILQAGILGAINTETLEIPSAQELKNNLPEPWTVDGTGPYTATSPNGNTFKVTKDGQIKEPSTGDLALLEKYCLEKSLMDIVDTNTHKFIGQDPIPEAAEELTLLNIANSKDGKFGLIYLKYNNKAYNIKVSNEDSLCKSVELKYEPKGREGEKVKYDSNNDGTEEDWMILYDNGENVEIISMTNIGEKLTLGTNDEQAQTPGDIDKNGIKNDYQDRAIYSYNNAIKRLNDYCTSLITNANKISVRSVGSNPNDPYTDSDELYKSENLKQWAGGRYYGIGKAGDENLEQDLIRTSYHNCAVIGEEYFLASRVVYDDSDSVSFNMYYMYNESGFYSNAGLCFIDANLDNGTGTSTSIGVRPVVKLSNI